MRGILLILFLALGGPPPISLRISPQVIFYNSKSPVAITIIITPNDNNRVGSLEISSGDYYTRSEFPITSAKVYRFERRVDTPGNYEVKAEVKRITGETFTARQALVVASGEALPGLGSKQQGS